MERSDDLSKLPSYRLAVGGDRLRHLGHGRLERVRRRRVAGGDGAGAWRSAATCSTRPGPTAPATASACSGGCWRTTAARRSTSQPRSRRRTASGRRGPTTGSRTSSRRTTSGSTRRRASRTSALDSVDLQQLHVWTDAWAEDERWQRAVEDLKREGLIKAFGISINRWEPTNVVQGTAHRSRRRRAGGAQHLRPGPRRRAVPAVPGAEGRRDLPRAVRRGEPDRPRSRPTSTFPKGDWRALYFQGENLRETLERVDRLKPVVPPGMTLADLALRFILDTRRSRRRFRACAVRRTSSRTWRPATAQRLPATLRQTQAAPVGLDDGNPLGLGTRWDRPTCQS